MPLRWLSGALEAGGQGWRRGIRRPRRSGCTSGGSSGQGGWGGKRRGLALPEQTSFCLPSLSPLLQAGLPAH